MLKIFLTGASIPNEFQNNPSLSIGGYVSSAEVINGELDYLFQGISEFSKLNNKPEYSLIAIKNVGKIKTGATIKLINPVGALSVMSLAVVEPSEDGDSNPFFEKLQTKWSAPYYASFELPAGQVDIPSIAKNAIYGIWIKREVSPSALVPMSVEDMNAAFEAGQELPTEDDIILDINYSE